MNNRTVYNALPKIPGFNFPELHPPVTRGRRQYCTLHEGSRTVLDAGWTLRVKSSNKSSHENSGCPSREEILAKLPDWNTLDDKTLRFFGYYMERVDESHVEKIRVRKVKICFYLSDGTVSVVETPAVVNSGLRRGTVVSRCKIDGVDFFSLRIGFTIQIRGVVYTLVDCDAATRDFCTAMELPQSDPLSYPEDAFEESVKVQKLPMDDHHITMRRCMEITAAKAAGTHASLLTREERKKARDFFEHDREVLCFYAVWDQRLFRIYYHIADQTVSVLMDHMKNDGRDPNSALIQRARIPRDHTLLLRDTETLNLPIGKPVSYISDEDFQTGQTINLLTRDFYIFDCDPYTRAYYQAKGIEQTSFPKPCTEEETLALPARRTLSMQSSEPGNVYGASAMVFQDMPTHKDRLKLTRYSNDAFRFAARLANPKPVDEGRQFILCYYLSDDTVSVYEFIVANNGHVGGKCFARSVVPDVNEPSKLNVGSKVKLGGVEYELTEMDERTKRYISMGMPTMSEEYFHTLEIINHARQFILQRFPRITEAFRHFRSSVDGLSSNDIRNLFIECGKGLNEFELENVMKTLDKDKDGFISLSEFTEQLLGHQLISDFSPKNERGINIGKGPLHTMKEIEASRALKRESDEALRKLISQSEARRILLVRACRTEANTSYDGHLGAEDFKRAMKDRLNLVFTEEEMDALVFKFYYLPHVRNWTSRRLPVKEVKRLIMM